MEAALSNPEQSLPSYGNPPLVETVLSVQFEPPQKLTVAHLGAFWHQRRDLWPTVQIQPPIESQIEVFDDVDQWLPPGIGLRLSRTPDVRVRMISANDDRVIQLQRDRLAYNWRRRHGEDYPRYPRLLEEFTEAWEDLQGFLSDENLETPKLRQWEVIYVNHIAGGELWDATQEWPQVLSGLLATVPVPTDEGAELRRVQGQWVFELAARRGRLYVDVAPGRTSDKPPKEILVLQFTARGPVTDQDCFQKGLNLGHRVIVELFDRLISPKAQAHWQRHDNAYRF